MRSKFAVYNFYVFSVAYPLARIDTINQETGQLNEDSALSLVVYGVCLLFMKIYIKIPITFILCFRSLST